MAQHVDGKDWISIVDDYIKWSCLLSELSEQRRKIESKRNNIISNEDMIELHEFGKEYGRTCEFFYVAENEYEKVLRLIPAFDVSDLNEPIKYLTKKENELDIRHKSLVERLLWAGRKLTTSSQLEDNDKEQFNSIIREADSEIEKIEREQVITSRVLKELLEKKDNLLERIGISRPGTQTTM